MFPLKIHGLSTFCFVAFVHVLSCSLLCSLCPSALVKAATGMKLEGLDAVARCGGVRVAASFTSSSSVTHMLWVRSPGTQVGLVELCCYLC